MARKAAKKTGKAKTAKKKPPAPAKGASKSAAKKITPKAAEIMAEVRELVDLMTANAITEIHMENGATKIVLRRGGAGEPEIDIPALAAPVGETPAPPAGQADAEKSDLIDIPSPMVGTFYSSPSPDAAPYITVGADITDDTVVCILEAMKVMNEIKAECSGTIAEVCVKNAQPVEFGQVLFRVRPV
jgi:acetyl-CoA carboxylase biotin carboxyl carrier protein